MPYQDFYPIHSRGQQKPVTVASAASITPVAALTFVTGTVQVANIVPLDPNSYQRVTLCFTNAAPGAFLTNGTVAPIKTAYQPIQNRPIDLHWDPSSEFWWVEAVV